MMPASKQLIHSPQMIASEGTKPCRIRKSTLDSLPDAFRRAGYALLERGELEIIGYEAL
jgi:hypothetical protein